MSDPRDPRYPGDANAPRPSQRPSRGPGTPQQSPGAPQPRTDPVVEGLLAYMAVTDIPPAPTLTARIRARVAHEPRQTPVRRFVVALMALKPGRAWFAFRQSAGAAVGRGTFPAIVRVQALALMLVAVMAVGALGAGGAFGLEALVRQPDHPAPTMPPSLVQPTGSPSPAPRAASPAPVPSAQPTPSPSIDSSVEQPGQTADPGHLPPAGTPSPTPPRDGTHTPRPTRTPVATPPPGGGKPTPTPTARPTRAPRPTETPEPTDHPKPTDPPETPQPTHTPRPTRTPRPTDTHEPDGTPDPDETPGDDHGGHGEGLGGPEWLAVVWSSDLVLLLQRL